MVPLDGEADFEVVWRFAHGAGAVLVKRHPEMLTQEFIKADRAGRILIDTGRNGPGATFAAVYAVRPKPGGPVSAPCTWQEIERAVVGPRTFTLRTMADRIGEVGDLWRDMDSQRCSLQRPVDQLAGTADRRRLERGHGRLDTEAGLEEDQPKVLAARS